jgi:hypothetical protein
MKKSKWNKIMLLAAAAMVVSMPAFAQLEEQVEEAPGGELDTMYFSDDYDGYTDSETADNTEMVDVEQIGEEDDLYDFKDEGEPYDPSVLDRYAAEQ